MPPQATLVNLSPAELSFLHSTLTQTPPLRLDVTKGPRDFRSMRAEHDVLPTANGSARIALDDGTEALVGVKAEVERTPQPPVLGAHHHLDMSNGDESSDPKPLGQNAWIEMSVEVPGFRDDDALPVFLASMLTESLLASGELKDRLYINRRFHWKLFIDILLLSPPLSYPLGLLSMATHLALLTTHLPALKSEKDEDPLFDDDWAAAAPLYPQSRTRDKPPVIILAISVGPNIIFDPCKEELAVADAVLAIACTTTTTSPSTPPTTNILSIRTIDPPSHLTPPAVPNSMNSATGGLVPHSTAHALTLREQLATTGVWTPPRGGMKRALVGRVAKMVVERGGVADEVVGALAGIEVG
ncbi:hypothetical protein EKO04_005836 [Ascochyta lentis]|uniref:Ribosomal RNA-processing protein 42 n=1 Tax=Ascochyta lentis TaxID=205686 RepID=A0A8H7J1G0_9PLEO|nr:hypothetical protein EKO04_005836 [Ascochyta lentis]